MKYFGKYWGAPICDSCERADIPVGEICFYCGEAIQESDRGFLVPEAYIGDSPDKPSVRSIHLECMVRSTVGSVGHLHKTCSCYGGEVEDPPDMTKREAAIAAFQEFTKND